MTVILGDCDRLSVGGVVVAATDEDVSISEALGCEFTGVSTGVNAPNRGRYTCPGVVCGCVTSRDHCC